MLGMIVACYSPSLLRYRMKLQVQPLHLFILFHYLLFPVPTTSSIPEKETLRTIKSCYRKSRHNPLTTSSHNPYPNWISENLCHNIMFGRDNYHDIVIREHGCVTFFCSFCSLWSLICYSVSSPIYFQTKYQRCRSWTTVLASILPR